MNENSSSNNNYEDLRSAFRQGISELQAGNRAAFREYHNIKSEGLKKMKFAKLLDKNFMYDCQSKLYMTSGLFNFILISSYFLTKGVIKRWKRITAFYVLFFYFNCKFANYYLVEYPISQYKKGVVKLEMEKNNNTL